MAREKVTITLDRDKAQTAQALANAPSTSEVIDRALDAFIRHERLRSDIAAYRAVPQAGAELRVADIADVDLEDETDWEALYLDAPA